MRSATFKLYKPVIAITLLAIITFGGGLLLMNGAAASNRDKIATGFLFDLLITFPLCYYFVIIRPLKKSSRSIILVLAVCCGIAYLVLPAHQRGLILQVRKLSALAELGFIIYAISKINKIRAVYKIQQLSLPDPLFNLRNAMGAVFGELLAVKVLASELAVWRYGILFWKKEKPLSKEVRPFSTHKESGYTAIWCILMLAVLVEVVAFHLLLMHWSRVAANIVTTLTAYSVVFFIADLSAIIKRQVLINGETVILRTGLRWRAIVEKANISDIKKVTTEVTGDDVYLKGSVIKTGANVLITFKTPVTIDKLYGTGKPYRSILMSIDNLPEFISALNLPDEI